MYVKMEVKQRKSSREVLLSTSSNGKQWLSIPLYDPINDAETIISTLEQFIASEKGLNDLWKK